MYKTGLVLGVVCAALAVILGAFGAHALKEVLAAGQLQVFETAVRYQVYHSFALIAAGIIHFHFPFKPVRLAAIFFFVGILLFSGSLYLLTALKINGAVGLSGLGMITPVGGLFFIFGWLALLVGVLRKQ